jgi:transcriptional regulator with XRE-family HTH domain
MRIGDVLRKEREAKGLNRHRPFELEAMAKGLGLSVEDYRELESGKSPLEKWFPLLCTLAVKLRTPTSRLLATTGKAQDTKRGQAGKLIRLQREERGYTVEEMAQLVGLEVADYVTIERGVSEIEKYGPLMLQFAEFIEQPVFNLYHPCGVPFDQLDDYP